MTTTLQPTIAPGRMRPEDELLLRCARVCVRSEPDQRISELVPRVTDWDHLLRLASQHGVSPLVSHTLSQKQPPDLPAAVASELRAALRDHAARTLQLTGVLIRLLDLFEANAIHAVPFKGPVLATMLYGHVGLRASVDLDILIRRQDILRAKDLMVQHGFQTDLPTAAAQQAAYLGARHELHFTPADGACLIELHQAFLAPFYSFAIDYDALWTRVQRQAFCGRDILTLSHSDLILALCAHATKHSWERLGWICDVARLLHVSREKLDWEEITTQASSIGATRMLMLGLSLASDLLGAPVPADVLQRAKQDQRVHHLASVVATALFAEPAGSDLRSHLFFLQARERLRDRVMYCSRLALTPTEEDHSLLRLPSLLSPLYYPFHAVRVAGKYGLAAIRKGSLTWAGHG
jgi:hypothetical protein